MGGSSPERCDPLPHGQGCSKFDSNVLWRPHAPAAGDEHDLGRCLHVLRQQQLRIRLHMLPHANLPCELSLDGHDALLGGGLVLLFHPHLGHHEYELGIPLVLVPRRGPGLRRGLCLHGPLEGVLCEGPHGQRSHSLDAPAGRPSLARDDGHNICLLFRQPLLRVKTIARVRSLHGNLRRRSVDLSDNHCDSIPHVRGKTPCLAF
mmetsp:Transcript_63512/g.133865  ORF Transcript_63512/g.133865 Transcript_63512/m.133865 type:complete len:205 (-) Transcript_63512:2219-2833(-)